MSVYLTKIFSIDGYCSPQRKLPETFVTKMKWLCIVKYFKSFFPLLFVQKLKNIDLSFIHTRESYATIYSYNDKIFRIFYNLSMFYSHGFTQWCMAQRSHVNKAACVTCIIAVKRLLNVHVACSIHFFSKNHNVANKTSPFDNACDSITFFFIKNRSFNFHIMRPVTFYEL